MLRLAKMVGHQVSTETVRSLRARLLDLQGSVSHVVQSSVVRSICNAWTTSGRFSGPRTPCPFGCGTPGGDKWSHFPVCPAIRRMWTEACPSCNILFFCQLTLELVLFVSPCLAPDVDVQIALWTDVVGHCANDARAMGSAPARVLAEGRGMMEARLRFLAVQGGCSRAVIQRIRVATENT